MIPPRSQAQRPIFVVHPMRALSRGEPPFKRVNIAPPQEGLSGFSWRPETAFVQECHLQDALKRTRHLHPDDQARASPDYQLQRYRPAPQQLVVPRTMRIMPPPDITIYYNKGRSWFHASKVVLCSQSRWFRNVLADPLKFAIPSLRLKSDLPFALEAVFAYLYTNAYAPFPSIHESLAARGYPNTTDLDYHILVYLTADKYLVPRLRSLAVLHYETLARAILSRDFHPICMLQAVKHHNIARCPWISAHVEKDLGKVTYSHYDLTIEAEVYRFINSICLIWKYTKRQDDLRQTVLQMVKESFHKLARSEDFVKLVRYEWEFGRDLKASLEEDGLALTMELGVELGVGLRFGDYPQSMPRG